jgi:hypothetical protein
MDNDSSRRWAILKAFATSFAIYLMPLIGPHAVWLLGEHLYSRLVRGGPDRVFAWIAMEWGLAVALQLVMGALAYVFFVRPKWWRLLPLIVCVPVFFVTMEWAYMVAIPTKFLIEQDTVSELGNWKSVCDIPDVSLAAVRSSPDLLLERAGQTWLAGTGVNAFAVLEMPRCRTTPLNFSDTVPLMSQPFVLPGGRCLFSTWDNKAGQNHWWIHNDTTRPLPRPPADPNRTSPIISTDGNWVAWLEYIPGATITPLPERVVIRSLQDERERIVNMPPPGPSEFVLLGVNTDAEELTFYEHKYATRQSSLTVIGFDGERRGQPLVADGVDPQATTFLCVDQGWVAWDAYRESEPYRVAWSLPKGHGTHQVLKGRGITAVAVDPGGTYIAVSTTTSLNIGHIKDAVYVLRASDGQEVWRRYLPAYARSSVTFLGERLFAHTDFDGTHVTVRVLQIPD